MRKRWLSSVLPKLTSALRQSWGKSVLSLTAIVSLSGCTMMNEQIMDDTNQLQKMMGKIERVSVLTTDGQELPLDFQLFSQGIVSFGRDLQQSSQHFNRDQIKFSLVVYRFSQAPMVIEMGENALQYNYVTYRGESAAQLYDFVRHVIGHSLFQKAVVQTVELNSADMGETIFVDQPDRDQFLREIRAGELVLKNGEKQYALFPNYRLRINTDDLHYQLSLATPTLLTLELGKETIAYRVNSSLFARFTDLAPAQESLHTFDHLFKASSVRISRYNNEHKQETVWRASSSLQMQGSIHQLVRFMKSSKQIEKPNNLSEPPFFVAEFVEPEKKTTVIFYDSMFAIDGYFYSYRGSGKIIQRLLEH